MIEIRLFLGMLLRSSNSKLDGSRTKFTSVSKITVGLSRRGRARGRTTKVILSAENWLARNADSCQQPSDQMSAGNVRADQREILEEEEEVTVYQPQKLTPHDVIKIRLVQAKLNG